MEPAPLRLALLLALAFQEPAQVLQGSLERGHGQGQEQLGGILHRRVECLDLPGTELRRLQEEPTCSDEGQLQGLNRMDAVAGRVDRRGQAGDPETAGPLAPGDLDRRTDFEIDFATTPHRRTPDVLPLGDAEPERNGLLSGRSSIRSAAPIALLHGENLREDRFSRRIAVRTTFGRAPSYSCDAGSAAITPGSATGGR